jgi:hypothetical protein
MGFKDEEATNACLMRVKRGDVFFFLVAVEVLLELALWVGAEVWAMAEGLEIPKLLRTAIQIRM